VNRVNDDNGSGKDRGLDPLLRQTEHLTRGDIVLGALAGVVVLGTGLVGIANPFDILATPACALMIVVGLGGLAAVRVRLRHGNPAWRSKEG
jgi:hypothetical protein